MHTTEPTQQKSTGLKRIYKAFLYSIDGIAAAIKHEAAFKQEAILAAFLIPVSFLLEITLAEHLILLASVLLVLIVELINSAIEAVVDDISLRHRPLAKRAKDLGSAAVLLSVLSGCTCWTAILLRCL